MKNLQVKTTPEVESIFNNYPEAVRSKMLQLRKLIIETAKEMNEVSQLEETLKWGEPSYLTKHGSTLRIDWKKKNPEQYAMYFKCTSRLIPSFKMVYGKLFEFEGTRAIMFQMDDTIPENELKQCIAAALRYHKVKHLPALGI